MDFESVTPENRRFSPLVPYIMIVAGAAVIVFVAALLLAPQSFFPDAIHDTLTVGVVVDCGSPKDCADRLAAVRTRVVKAFADNGLGPDGFVVDKPLIQRLRDAKNDYEGSQEFRVPADDYPRFARFANRINRLRDPDFGISFPASPIQSGFTWAMALALIFAILATAGLEIRRTDVSRAPRGMHPFVVAIETVAYGAAAALAIYDAHAYFDAVAPVVAILEAVVLAVVVAWLYQSRWAWKNSEFYRAAYVAYIVAVPAVAAIAIWALLRPVV